MRPRVLAIATNWPPNRGARSIQNHRLLTAPPLPVRLHIPDEQTYLVKRTEKEGALEIVHLGTRETYNLARGLARLKLGGSLIPDRYVGWALRVAATERNGDHDVLLTISKFESAHVSGLLLKRQHPHVPWVALFSDPWTEMEPLGYVKYGPVSRRINRKLEAKVINNADVSIFTNQETLELFAAEYPSAASRFRILAQGYDPTLYGPQTPNVSGALVLRYLGEFYGPRSPRPILKALAALNDSMPNLGERVRVEFVGIWKNDDLNECLQLLDVLPFAARRDPVPSDEALRLMQQSDCLLLIDAPAVRSPFLPSKLIDYIGADRPILAVTPPGAAARVVRETGGLVASPIRPSEIVDALRQLITEHENRSLPDRSPPAETRARYAIEQIRNQLYEWLRTAGVIRV